MQRVLVRHFVEEMRVFIILTWGAARTADQNLSTFPEGKVPAGRMRVTQIPHQSRCARQLSIHHPQAAPEESLKVSPPAASEKGKHDTLFWS